MVSLLPPGAFIVYECPRQTQLDPPYELALQAGRSGVLFYTIVFGRSGK